MSRQALYVGIGNYDAPAHPDLEPAVRAARQLAELLARNHDGSPWWPDPQGPVLLTTRNGGRVTEPQLLAAFDRLLVSSKHDHLLFYFAGHGRPVQRRGRGLDLLLTSSDDGWTGDQANRGEPKGLWAADLFKRIRDAEPASATVILDCCHAGLAARAWRPGAKDTGIVLMAAAEADQAALSASAESVPQFTRFLLEGLNSGASDIQGRVTAMSLYAYAAGVMVAQSHGHVPVFKGEVQSLVTLRKTQPVLSQLDLERLALPVTVDGEEVPPGFDREDQVIQARPEWETEFAEHTPPPLSRPRGLKYEDKTDAQKLMDYYNRLRRAGLAETTDQNDDLYWTVIASIDEPGRHGVRLTPLGRYYFELSRAGRIGRADD
ncbi:MAG: caspase family protein [Bifidobacteriaceae bacterium]|nr:caspase family protein [Bifidobacteriaceae bacterium]